jgi:hypothetical protein
MTDELELENEYINMELGVWLLLTSDHGWRSYKYPGGDLFECLSEDDVREWVEADRQFVPVAEDKWECSLEQTEILTGSFPTEPAKVFLYRLGRQPGWTIRVQNMRTNNVYLVNGITGEIESYE